MKKREEQSREVKAVHLVANLLSFMPMNSVQASIDSAIDDISEVTMELDGCVLRAGNAACPKNAHRHVITPRELLTKEVGRGL
jgi:hypothetical protein